MVVVEAVDAHHHLITGFRRLGRAISRSFDLCLNRPGFDRSHGAALGVDPLDDGERLLFELISEVLDLSRIELGKMEVECKPTNLGIVLNEAVSMVTPLAEQYVIDLQGCGECSAEVIVMVDPLKIRAVLVNLLSNAIKYNQKGGSVAASCKQNQDVIELSITDTGIGIADDHLEKLFEPFERFASELAEVDGTGIGLTISRSLIELMGGSITVESKPQNGSCFTISLPVYKGD